MGNCSRVSDPLLTPIRTLVLSQVVIESLVSQEAAAPCTTKQNIRRIVFESLTITGRRATDDSIFVSAEYTANAKLLKSHDEKTIAYARSWGSSGRD